MSHALTIFGILGVVYCIYPYECSYKVDICFQYYACMTRSGVCTNYTSYTENNGVCTLTGPSFSTPISNNVNWPASNAATCLPIYSQSCPEGTAQNGPAELCRNGTRSLRLCCSYNPPEKSARIALDLTDPADLGKFRYQHDVSQASNHIQITTCLKDTGASRTLL